MGVSAPLAVVHGQRGPRVARCVPQRTILNSARAAPFNPPGAFEPGRLLAVVLEEFPASGIVEVHDVTDGRLVTALEPEADKPLALTFDSAGQYLAGGTRNGRA